jgi:hypothetical protein
MNADWETLIQLGFISNDIHAAMSELTRTLNVGPWFIRERGSFQKQAYRGNPTTMSLAVAMGYIGGGPLQYEVIQQLDDLPSIYRDFKPHANVGFHHFGIATRDFDRSADSYHARGFELVYEADVPGGVRVCYFDTLSSLPGMVELIEVSLGLTDMFEGYRAASVDWRGDRPVRPRDALPT